jgi:hypothetical protein
MEGQAISWEAASKPIPTSALRGWLLEQELAVDHGGTLTPARRGVELGELLSDG